MIAEDADLVPQGIQRVLIERPLIGGIRGIGIGGHPAAFTFSTAHAPKTIFRPEENAQFIASIGKSRMMRIMRPPNKIEPRILDEFHIPKRARVRNGIAPARVILVHIGPMEIEVFAINEKA